METHHAPDGRGAVSSAACRAADPSLLAERLALLPTDRLPLATQSPQLYQFLRGATCGPAAADEIYEWLCGIQRSERMASLQKQFPQLVPKVKATQLAQTRPAIKGLKITLDLDDDPSGWGAPQHALADRSCVIGGVRLRLICTDAQAKALAGLLVRRGRELESVRVVALPAQASQLAVFLDGIKTAAGLASLMTTCLDSALDHGGLSAAIEALLIGGNLRSLAITVSDARGLGVVARRVAAHLPRCGLGHLAIDVMDRAPKAALLDAIAVLARPGNGLYGLHLSRSEGPWTLELAGVLPALLAPCDLRALQLDVEASDRQTLTDCFIDACLERNALILDGHPTGAGDLAAIVSRMVVLHLQRERRLRHRLVNALLLLKVELTNAFAAKAIDHGPILELLAGDLRRVMSDLRAQIARGVEPEILAPPAPGTDRAQGGSVASLIVRHWLGPGRIQLDEQDAHTAPSGAHALFCGLGETVTYILTEIPQFAKDDHGFAALCDDVLRHYVRQVYESVIGATLPLR
jgi:hypothetical protein